jgi:inositol oxygenase
MTNFRNYSSSNENNQVEKTYKNMLQNQTIEFVLEKKKFYKNNPNLVINIWDTIDKLDSIIDDSDPDSELPQIVHAYQTSISLKNKSLDLFYIKSLFSKLEWDNLTESKRIYFSKSIKNFYNNICNWDWLPLIGLIHDMGKVLLLDEFGKLDQWAVVGDTFPVGYKLSPAYIYQQKGYHLKNESLIKNNYNKGIGFNNLLMSWGHDEYLASVLEKNKTFLSKEAIYIIRFHSFYSWHSPKDSIRGYTDLADDFDWYMLPLLKFFQKSDLYSKTRNIPEINEIKKEFNILIDKYFLSHLINW